ncbi:hypothetical protein RHOSPDRAFT_20170, partial [Rhodotorula sp. JG-1b]
ILVLALLPRPLSTWDKVQLYALQPATTVPMIPLTFMDFPRRWPWTWQLLVYLSVWLFASANPIDMYRCDFFIPDSPGSCDGKDFQSTLFYASAMPVVALFALGQKRIFLVLFMASWVALLGATILRQHQRYAQLMVNELIFLGFITFLHYLHEMCDRRMYTMRAELKASYRAQQRAQVGERKQIDARERFTNYIFHEVRVPLNSALLAVQNIKNAAADHEVHSESESAADFVALDSSLQLMTQVLNDVLDHSCLERGVFSSVQQPFSLHKVMQSIAIPLKLEAVARGLTLDTACDKRVDEAAVRAAFLEEDASSIREGDGIVIGDEVRLRQILGNLASNACKFTSSGGTIGLKTTLVGPIAGGLPVFGSTAPIQSGEDLVELEKGESLPQDGRTKSPATKPMLVIRFEVTDTGVGIRSSDMSENRLFSPYVQTSAGREQGGKGTGLGLALVRQIVSLMGGRLGVQSRVGHGTTVWVELAFPIATAAEATTPSTESSFRRSLLVSPGVSSSAAASHRYVGIAPTRPALVPQSAFGDQQGRNSGASSPPFSSSSPSPQPTPSVKPVLAPSTESAGGATGPAPEAEATRDTSSSVPKADPPTALSIPSPNLPTSSASLPAMSPQNGLASPPPLSSVSASQVSLTSPRPKAASTPSKKLHIDGPPLKVLIVDDDMLTRRLMSRMMQRLGCEVETAENGRVALDLIQGEEAIGEKSEGTTTGMDAFHHYDVVFLDNQMPVCSGVEVVTELRSLGRNDLVVGVTANALKSDQEQYLEAGASFLLTKPVKEPDFIRYLRLADKRRAGRADPAQQVHRQATSSSQFPHFPGADSQ